MSGKTESHLTSPDCSSSTCPESSEEPESLSSLGETSTRRTSAVSGCVRFPIDDPEWPSSQEGGIFVKLYFVEKNPFSWSRCCAQDAVDVLGESLQGYWHNGKLHTFPEMPEGGFEDLEDLEKWTKKSHMLEDRLFPRCNEDYDRNSRSDIERFLSVPMVACLTLGTTGWSGWNGMRHWLATPDDLTPRGKILLESLIDNYPGCDWFLATFLDT